MTRSNQTRKALAAAAAFAAVLGLSTLSAGPAGAVTWTGAFESTLGSTSGYVNIRTTPVGSVFYVARNGTRAHMRCWTTGPTAYGTAKWFVIQIPNQPWYGYVNANLVAGQIVVGRC